MNTTIEWQKPVQLTLNKRLLFDYKSIPAAIGAKPGVYFFSREHGSKLKPFYIGESLSVRGRLIDHLKTVKIMDVLRGQFGDIEIKNGRRYFHYGYLSGNPSKDAAKKRIEIVQRLMIRLAIEEGIPILNKGLTKITTHSIDFTGQKSGRGLYQKSYEVPVS